MATEVIGREAMNQATSTEREASVAIPTPIFGRLIAELTQQAVNAAESEKSDEREPN
ncbi:hypothetical protein ACFQ73_40630 [Amycolatopsis japonica]|uniref:hypothetical protein n=1 Tax=Amycolatopsis japonica TaxID=208439 RepID=UPI003670BF6F